MAAGVAHVLSDDDVKPADAVEVGRILGGWGVQGGLKIKPLSSDPQALFSSKRWFIEPSEAKPGHQVPAVLSVIRAKVQGDAVVATTQEVKDRDVARDLAGARVFISRANFPPPDDNEFYWVDLIGLSVQDRAAQPLGVIVGLIETGPHCVIRIQPADPKAEETLIPFVDAYVDRVDLAGRTVHVDWDSDF